MDNVTTNDMDTAENDVTEEEEVGDGITYRQHNKIVTKALEACNIRSTKITHLMRVCSAREAESRNVDADQLSRLAGWRTGAKNNCYTNDLPMQTLRALAEWPIIGGGFSYLEG